MPKLEGIVERQCESKVRVALEDTRIVGLIGPRQSGKSTLAENIAREFDMQGLSLDGTQIFKQAKEDPDGFLRHIDKAVIYEIQRVPELLLALIRNVDKDSCPGRFLITSSADLFPNSVVPESLAGRIEIIQCLPLSQSEIEQTNPSEFLDRAFANDLPVMRNVGYTADLIERVIRGGYPEVLKRSTYVRHSEWLKSYTNSLVTGNIQEIAKVNKIDQFSKLLERLTVYAGSVTNLKKIANGLNVDEKTIDQWIFLLEQLFVVRRIPAWDRNKLKRMNKSPKLHFHDSGLLATLQDVSVEMVKLNRDWFKQLLKNFVFSELYKLSQLDNDEISIYHYREQSVYEIDFVMEKAGKVIGIEVKSSTGIKPVDFRALKRLKDDLGETFVCGIILHDGDLIQSPSEKLYAMPVSQLWAQ